MGHVTQQSILAAPGYPGNDEPQTTVTAMTRSISSPTSSSDPLGTPVKTHYERGDKSRIKWIDQDVRAGALPLRTLYSYDEPPPVGILETPSQIKYPNGRVDILSSFDKSMGGPQAIVLDAGSQSSEQRYAQFDDRGRLIEEGEIDRFAQQYQYSTGNRLQAIRHRLDKSSPWMEKRLEYHDVGGEAVTDSFSEPTRLTRYSYFGRYPYQEDLAGLNAEGVAPATSQTRCFNYSNDGRLEDEILPRGQQRSLRLLRR